MAMPANCPFCNQEPRASFLAIRAYNYCKNCDVAWMRKLSKTTYDTSYYKGKSTLAAKLFSPLGKFFYTIRTWYAGVGQKRVWIDIGAGDGGYLQTVFAKKRIGVEISSSGRKMMREKGLETLSNKQFLKSKNLRADVISFWHVLEHVEKPWEYLNAAKRNLRRGGKIVIGIPNINSLETKLTKKYWFHLQPEFHLWHFSTNAAKKLIRKSGFHIVTIDYVSIEHHPTGILQSFINKSSGSQDNVLHKIIKRGTGNRGPKAKDLFWSFFWLTIGLPVVTMFWIVGALLHKSGTIVVVATSNSQ